MFSVYFFFYYLWWCYCIHNYVMWCLRSDFKVWVLCISFIIQELIFVICLFIWTCCLWTGYFLTLQFFLAFLLEFVDFVALHWLGIVIPLSFIICGHIFTFLSVLSGYGLWHILENCSEVQTEICYSTGNIISILLIWWQLSLSDWMFVIVFFSRFQVGESEPFVSELLTSLPTTIVDLEPHQIHSFYESVCLYDALILPALNFVWYNNCFPAVLGRSYDSSWIWSSEEGWIYAETDGPSKSGKLTKNCYYFWEYSSFEFFSFCINLSVLEDVFAHMLCTQPC